MSDAQNNNLPVGWARTTVGEISEQIQYGYTAKSTEEPIGPKFLRITDIQDNTVNWKEVPYCEIDDDLKPKYLLKEGDLVFARTGSTVGKSFLLKGDIPESVFASYLIRISFLPQINKKFISYFFRSAIYWSQILQSKIGIGQPNVNGTLLSKIKLPFPPLEEQQRIIEKIETQFSKIDKAVNALKRIQINLQRLRTATLKWAFEGKLIKAQSELVRQESCDYESTNQLLKRILQQRRANWENNQLIKMQEQGKVFRDNNQKLRYKDPIEFDTKKLPNLPEGWLWVEAQTICEKIQDGTHFSPKKQFSFGQYKYITAKNIRPLRLDLSNLTYIDEEQHKTIYARCDPKLNDVLLVKDGVNTGDVVVNPLAEEFSLLSSVCIMRTLEDYFLPKFLCYYLLSPSGAKYLLSKMTGTAIKRVSLEKIKVLPVPLSPYAEQKKIVQEIERRFSTIDKLEIIVKTNIQRAETLRQKILQEAFDGKLVEQKKEDNSAESILDTIKKEKEEKGLNGKKSSMRNRHKNKADNLKISSQDSLFLDKQSVMDNKKLKSPSDIKLFSLKLEGEYKSLIDFEQLFRTENNIHQDISPICLVGLNGSGKSNLIEALSEIFCYLELINLPFKGKGTFQQNKQRDLQFEIEYELIEKGGAKQRFIKITKEKSRRPNFHEIINGIEKRIDVPQEQLAALPKWIIGYSSGLNETISIPYAQIQYYYSQDVGVRALQEDSESFADIRTLFMDYDSNAAILVANYLLGLPDNLNLFREKLRINDVASFDLVFQLKHTHRRPVELTRELKGYMDDFLKCATTVNTEKKGKTVKEIYSFKIDEETKEQFRKKFKSAKKLFIALYKFSLLNSLALTGDERRFYLRDDLREGSLEKPPTVTKDEKVFNIDSLRLKITEPEKEIDYAGISDGEHQFIQVFGSIQLFDDPGTLFLLDEPESHFNPRWRREFVQYLDRTISTKNQEFVISTHSPFIVSGCRKENVFHFERERGRIYCHPVDFETYGSSFEYLLTKLFKLESLISKQAFEEMRDVIKSQNLKRIEDAIENFGESFEKRFLYQEAAKIKKEAEKQK